MHTHTAPESGRDQQTACTFTRSGEGKLSAATNNAGQEVEPGMSPAQVLCAVAVFALVQMASGVHHTTAHAVDYPLLEGTATGLDLAPFLEWLADGLRDEQAAGALEDPEVVAAREGL